jgi:ribosomal protein S10
MSAIPTPMGHVRRVTYRFNSTDVRRYALTETIRRAKAAVVQAGGERVSAVRTAPAHIRRWCVLRSPHVNKTSREHFWLRTHRRSFVWEAPAGSVAADVEVDIARRLPGNVATRVVVDAPAFWRLRDIVQTMETARGLGDISRNSVARIVD